MSLGTPALLFGAIALTLLAYTNRFFVLARLIRDIHSIKNDEDVSLEKKQIPNLRTRIRLVQVMQAFGIISFLLCTISMLFIFIDMAQTGKTVFIISVLSLMLSLLFSLWEVLLSTRALDLVLDDFHKRNS